MTATKGPGGTRPPTTTETEHLQAWRALALDSDGGMPYMASMLFSLRPLAAPGLETFAVDASHRLYVDFDAVIGKGPRWCAEALLHECCHLFADHAGRATDAGVALGERMMSNIAADAESNDDLAAAGCESIRTDGVLPHHLGAPDNQTYEFYLALLRQQGQQGQASPAGGGDVAGPGSGPGSGPGDDGFSGCGSGSGGVRAPCELDADDDADGTAPAITEGEKVIAVSATAGAIRDQAAKGRGTVPAGLVDRAAMIFAPTRTPWRRLLAARVRAAVGSRSGSHDVTWRRRNRRVPSVVLGRGRALLPGRHSPMPTIAVVRDTSGSMSADDLGVATREVIGIARQLGIRGRDLMVLDCDAVVQTKTAFKGPASLEVVHGRGGTDMVEGIATAVALRPRPDAIVIVTDGYTPWPTEAVGVACVACIVGSGANESVPSWMTTVVADDLADGTTPRTVAKG